MMRRWPETREALKLLRRKKTRAYLQLGKRRYLVERAPIERMLRKWAELELDWPAPVAIDKKQATVTLLVEFLDFWP